jgi:hypothetical protein
MIRAMTIKIKNLSSPPSKKSRIRKTSAYISAQNPCNPIKKRKIFPLEKKLEQKMFKFEENLNLI